MKVNLSKIIFNVLLESKETLALIPSGELKLFVVFSHDLGRFERHTSLEFRTLTTAAFRQEDQDILYPINRELYTYQNGFRP